MFILLRFLYLAAGLLAAIAVLTAACDSDDPPDWLIQSDLVGSWRLVVSCGGIAGGCTWADSTGAFRIMTLSANGDYTEIVNDSIVFQGHYRIEHRKWEINTNTTDCIRVDGPYMERCVIRLTDDSLTIADDCIDCYTYTYVALGSI